MLKSINPLMLYHALFSLLKRPILRVVGKPIAHLLLINTHLQMHAQFSLPTFQHFCIPYVSNVLPLRHSPSTQLPVLVGNPFTIRTSNRGTVATREKDCEQILLIYPKTATN